MHSDHKLPCYGLVSISEIKFLQSSSFLSCASCLDIKENKWVWSNGNTIDSYKILEKHFKNKFEFIFPGTIDSSIFCFHQIFFLKKCSWLFLRSQILEPGGKNLNLFIQETQAIKCNPGTGQCGYMCSLFGIWELECLETFSEMVVLVSEWMEFCWTGVCCQMEPERNTDNYQTQEASRSTSLDTLWEQPTLKVKIGL